MQRIIEITNRTAIADHDKAVFIRLCREANIRTLGQFEAECNDFREKFRSQPDVKPISFGKVKNEIAAFIKANPEAANLEDPEPAADVREEAPNAQQATEAQADTGLVGQLTSAWPGEDPKIIMAFFVAAQEKQLSSVHEIVENWKEISKIATTNVKGIPMAKIVDIKKKLASAAIAQPPRQEQQQQLPPRNDEYIEVGDSYGSLIQASQQTVTVQDALDLVGDFPDPYDDPYAEPVNVGVYTQAVDPYEEPIQPITPPKPLPQPKQQQQPAPTPSPPFKQQAPPTPAPAPAQPAPTPAPVVQKQAQAAPTQAKAPAPTPAKAPVAQPQAGNEKQDEQYVSEIKALIIDRERKRWSKHDADMKALQAAHDETLRVSKDNHAKQQQARREEIERILAEKQRAYDKRYNDFHREQRLAKESHEKLSQGFETVVIGVKRTVVPNYLLSQMKLEGKKTAVQPPVFNHILNVLRNPEHKGVSKLPATNIKPAWDSLQCRKL